MGRYLVSVYQNKMEFLLRESWSQDKKCFAFWNGSWHPFLHHLKIRGPKLGKEAKREKHDKMKKSCLTTCSLGCKYQSGSRPLSLVILWVTVVWWSRKYAVGTQRRTSNDVSLSEQGRGGRVLYRDGVKVWTDRLPLPVGSQIRAIRSPRGPSIV